MMRGAKLTTGDCPESKLVTKWYVTMSKVQMRHCAYFIPIGYIWKGWFDQLHFRMKYWKGQMFTVNLAAIAVSNTCRVLKFANLQQFERLNERGSSSKHSQYFYSYFFCHVWILIVIFLVMNLLTKKWLMLLQLCWFLHDYWF